MIIIWIGDCKDLQSDIRGEFAFNDVMRKTFKIWTSKDLRIIRRIEEKKCAFVHSMPQGRGEAQQAEFGSLGGFVLLPFLTGRPDATM